MNERTIYMLSNGSTDVYDSNTLTSFSNKIPLNLEASQGERWEIAVAGFGVSTNFRNIELPLKRNVPSLIISNMAKPANHEYQFKFQKNEDMRGCEYKEIYFEDKIYSEKDIRDIFQRINDENPYVHFSVVDGKLKISNHTDRGVQFPRYFVFMHASFLKSFGIIPRGLDEGEQFEYKDLPFYFANHKFKRLRTESNIFQKFVRHPTYDENYYCYFMNNPELPFNGTKKIEDVAFPKLIQIECTDIEPQILNNNFYSHLAIFTPAFKQNERYYYREFQSMEYTTLQNTILKKLSFKIRDEFEEQLQLLPGPATLIKLHLRKMSEPDKSFNVRLVSGPNTDFPRNTNTSFRVKLPQKLELNRNWKVALTNINYPTKFSTFLHTRSRRAIFFLPRNEANSREVAVGEMKAHIFDELIEYTEEKFIDEIRNFFTRHDIGSVTYSDNLESYVIRFKKLGILSISNDILDMLGYDKNEGVKGNHISMFNVTDRFFMSFPKTKINIDLMRPTYIMLYANFITNTVVGGEFAKLLKVIPLEHSERDYNILDIKNKEFCELENTQIQEIEIDLRSHDGTPINFSGKKIVILNLEFSNYSN